MNIKQMSLSELMAELKYWKAAINRNDEWRVSTSGIYLDAVKNAHAVIVEFYARGVYHGVEMPLYGDPYYWPEPPSWKSLISFQDALRYEAEKRREEIERFRKDGQARSAEHTRRAAGIHNQPRRGRQRAPFSSYMLFVIAVIVLGVMGWWVFSGGAL